VLHLHRVVCHRDLLPAMPALSTCDMQAGDDTQGPVFTGEADIACVVVVLSDEHILRFSADTAV